MGELTAEEVKRWAEIIGKPAGAHKTQLEQWCVTASGLLLQLLQAQEWKPIETVPKDGTHVDLWLQSYRLADRDKDEMIPSVGFRISDAHWYDEMWCDDNGMPHEDLDGWPDSRITYWRPLPLPPFERAYLLPTKKQGEQGDG